MARGRLLTFLFPARAVLPTPVFVYGARFTWDLVPWEPLVGVVWTVQRQCVGGEDWAGALQQAGVYAQ